MNIKGKLIDTNILVYAYDISEKEKYPIAQEIVKSIWEEGEGITTLQNLMEFFIVITSKIERPVSIEVAKSIIEDFLESDKWIIIDRDSETFLESIEHVSNYGIHFWDALIGECMLEFGITDIITENVGDFNKIPKLNAENPF